MMSKSSTVTSSLLPPATTSPAFNNTLPCPPPNSSAEDRKYSPPCGESQGTALDSRYFPSMCTAKQHVQCFDRHSVVGSCEDMSVFGNKRNPGVDDYYLSSLLSNNNKPRSTTFAMNDEQRLMADNGDNTMRALEAAISELASLLNPVNPTGDDNQQQTMLRADSQCYLSRPIQRKLVNLLKYRLAFTPDARERLLRCIRSLAERALIDFLQLHQNPTLLTKNLWMAVRNRGCQFLGPAMQEEVLRLILLALEDGSALSRKVLVLFVVQKLLPHYPRASKTSVGHVVQLLYRASCFKLQKREDDSSLMQLKEEFRNYDSLRREHDAQIIQIAMDACLRISPESWSSLLYGDSEHRSQMQSIMDRLQITASQSFGGILRELQSALQRSGDPYDLGRLLPDFDYMDKETVRKLDNSDVLDNGEDIVMVRTGSGNHEPVTYAKLTQLVRHLTKIITAYSNAAPLFAFSRRYMDSNNVLLGSGVLSSLHSPSSPMLFSRQGGAYGHPSATQSNLCRNWTSLTSVLQPRESSSVTKITSFPYGLDDGQYKQSNPERSDGYHPSYGFSDPCRQYMRTPASLDVSSRLSSDHIGQHAGSHHNLMMMMKHGSMQNLGNDLSVSQPVLPSGSVFNIAPVSEKLDVNKILHHRSLMSATAGPPSVAPYVHRSDDVEDWDEIGLEKQKLRERHQDNISSGLPPRIPTMMIRVPHHHHQDYDDGNRKSPASTHGSMSTRQWKSVTSVLPITTAPTVLLESPRASIWSENYNNNNNNNTNNNNSSNNNNANNNTEQSRISPSSSSKIAQKEMVELLNIDTTIRSLQMQKEKLLRLYSGENIAAEKSNLAFHDHTLRDLREAESEPNLLEALNNSWPNTNQGLKSSSIESSMLRGSNGRLSVNNPFGSHFQSTNDTVVPFSQTPVHNKYGPICRSNRRLTQSLMTFLPLEERNKCGVLNDDSMDINFDDMSKYLPPGLNVDDDDSDDDDNNFTRKFDADHLSPPMPSASSSLKHAKSMSAIQDDCYGQNATDCDQNASPSSQVHVDLIDGLTVEKRLQY